MFQSCIRSNKKYLLEVLSSNRYEAKQTAFIERVKFLKGQHEFLIGEKVETSLILRHWIPPSYVTYTP